MIRRVLVFVIGFGSLFLAFADGSADDEVEMRIVRMSAGGGGFYGEKFGGGVRRSFLRDVIAVNTPYTSGGFYGFFDAQYVEASAGFMFGEGRIKTKRGAGFFDLFNNPDVPDYYRDLDLKGNMSLTFLNLDMLFKFPIVSKSKTSFPALGITYSYCLSAKLDDKDFGDASDFNRMWFKFGYGTDFRLSQKMYMRILFLYGFGKENEFERKLIEISDKAEASIIDQFDRAISHGFDIRVGLGFRL